MNDIKVNNISFHYKESEKLILKDINIDIKSGEFLCILGQSGCGKSTFLRLLAGLEFPSSGDILINDEKITKASLDRGVVFQDYGLFPWMTVSENIILALEQKFPKKTKQDMENITKSMLSNVGLSLDVYNKLPKELSGGMKQRCAIAQAFCIDPPILLMDEPFGALDAVTRAKLQDLIKNLWNQDKNKKTVVFVTHDVDEALLLSNRIIVLGQSPSSIIYDLKISEANNITRENQFENPNILDIRNKLIKIINQDVSLRVTETTM